MTAHPGWTPAARPGIVPLHPLGFGTILGRSFTALRQNPRVLLGFALGIQAIGYLVMIVAVGAVAFWSTSRLDTVPPGSDEWNAITAGSIALTIVAGVVFGIAVTALTVIVQGVVVAEVAREVVAEKQSVRQLWTVVRPVVWRLLGYTLMISAALVVGLGLVVLALVALGSVGRAGVVAAVVLGILLFLAAIPLLLWLSTKLALVPAVIVLERTTIRGGIARSWRLIRGRFWPALGVIVVVQLSISAAAQLVAVPFTLLSTIFAAILFPTGDNGSAPVVAVTVATLLPQALVLLVQSIGVVVQATATTLIYVDCRMRHDGLDLDLLEYVERRDAGVPGLPDPYTVHVGLPRAARPGYGAPAYGAAPGYGAYPHAAAPDAGYPPAPAGYPSTPAAYPPPVLPAPVGYPSSPPPAPAVNLPAPTQWAAPGAPAPDEPDREAP